MADSFEEGGTFLTEAVAFDSAPPPETFDHGGVGPLGVPAPQVHPPVTPGRKAATGSASPHNVPAPPSASLDRTRPTAGKNTRLLVQEGTTLKWGGAPYAVADMLPPSLQKKRPATSNAQMTRRPLATGDAAPGVPRPAGSAGLAAAAPGRGPALLARAGPVTRPRTSLARPRAPLYPGGLANAIGSAGAAGAPVGAGAAPAPAPLSKPGSLLPPGAGGSAASRLSALRARSAVGAPRSGLPASASTAGSVPSRRMSSGGASTGGADKESKGPSVSVPALNVGGGAGLPQAAAGGRAGFAGRALGSAGASRRPGTGLLQSGAGGSAGLGGITGTGAAPGTAGARPLRPGTTGPSFLGGGRRGLSASGAGSSRTPLPTPAPVATRAVTPGGASAGSYGARGSSLPRPPASAPGVSRRSLTSGTGSRLSAAAARGGLPGSRGASVTGARGLPTGAQPQQQVIGRPGPPPSGMQGGVLFESEAGGEDAAGHGTARSAASPASSASSSSGAQVYAFSVDNSAGGSGEGSSRYGSPADAKASSSSSGGALLSMSGDPSTLTHAQRQFILQEEYRRSLSPMHTGSTPPSARAPPSPTGAAIGAASLGISGVAAPGSPGSPNGNGPQMSKSGLFRLGPALGVPSASVRPFPPASSGGASVAPTPTSLLPSPAFGIAPGPAVPLNLSAHGYGNPGMSGSIGQPNPVPTPRGPTTDVFSTTFDPVAVLNRAVAVANKQSVPTPAGYPAPTPRGSMGGSLFPPSSYAPPSFSSTFVGAPGYNGGGASNTLLGGTGRFYPMPASLMGSSAAPTPTAAGPGASQPGNSSSGSRPGTTAGNTASSSGPDFTVAPPSSSSSSGLDPASMQVPLPTPNIMTRGSLALQGLSRGSGPALHTPLGGSATPSSAPVGGLFPTPQLRPATTAGEAGSGSLGDSGHFMPASARPGSNTTMLATTPRGAPVTTSTGLVLPRGMALQPGGMPVGFGGGPAPVAAVSSVSSEITARLQARIQEAFGRVSEQVRHAFTAPSKPGVLGVPMSQSGGNEEGK